MRTAFLLLTAALFVAAPVASPAQTAGQVIQGYLVDASCAAGMMVRPETATKRAARHTRACALDEECSKSGYGLITEGRWVKFDAAGDRIALELLKKSRTERGMVVAATGRMAGERFAVTALEEKTAPASPGASPRQPAEKKKGRS